MDAGVPADDLHLHQVHPARVSALEGVQLGGACGHRGPRRLPLGLAAPRGHASPRGARDRLAKRLCKAGFVRVHVSCGKRHSTQWG